MIVTRFGIIPDPPATFIRGGGDSLAPAPLPRSHRVEVSHLSEENIRRIRNFLEEVSKRLIKAPTWRVVYVNRKTGAYWRRAPGAAKLEKALGPEFFRVFGALVDVGLQAYEDSQRSDLDGAQRLGRASLALLLALLPPLGLLWAGATILFPTATDNATAWLFSPGDPVVQGLSNFIFWVGEEWMGEKRFEEWSTTPSGIDFF
jgi:hypothetical protein